MTIELSKEEVETLEAALDAWQKQPSSIAELMSGFMGSDDGSPAERFQKAKKDSESASKQRERTAILLRARLIMASAQTSNSQP